MTIDLENVVEAIGQLSSVVEELKVEIADLHGTIKEGLYVQIDNRPSCGLDVNIINDVLVSSFGNKKPYKSKHAVGQVRHSTTCAITKTGTDDPDCTCGLQEVLDDEARDLAEEALSDEENQEAEQGVK